MVALLNWGLNHWWYIWLLAWLGVFDGVRDFFITIAYILSGRRDELPRDDDEEPPAILPTPGPCVHRRVVPVHDGTGERVAWICGNPDCGKQLPKDWAVEAADLPDPRSGHDGD